MNDSSSARRTVFLGWQDTIDRRAWYPVGCLSVDPSGGDYVFGYTRGALAAQERSGFTPLYDFPAFESIYRSEQLFPLFKNRVMTPQRESFQAYLRQLDIADSDPYPLEILAVDGGYRVTDSFQVFPKIEKREKGAFRCRFFLHGWRHTNDASRARVDHLREGENLHVAIELANPATGCSVQIQSEDYQVLGWAPRYLVGDLVQAMAHAPGDYCARVVKVNPIPAPSKQRVLIELSGHWPEAHEPMAGPEFQLMAR